MNLKMQILQSELLLPVILGGLTLLLLYWYKEWRTTQGRVFLFLNLGVAFLLVVSLALLILKPAYLQEHNSGSGILLTSGYDDIRLDSLRTALKSPKVINYDSNRLDLYSGLDSVQYVSIIGTGIPQYDAWLLREKQAQFLGHPKIEGVTALSYPRKVMEGDPLVISGRISSPAVLRHFHLLNPAGVVLDSVTTTVGQTQSFQWTTETSVPGRYTFQMLELNPETRDTLGISPLPLEVLKDEKLTILVLQQFPTFELRFLKNMLAEAGHELVLRTQITRNRFKYEFLNSERTSLGRLNTDMLNGFDLVIADWNSNRNLSGATKGALKEAVRDGLGVFILPETSVFSSKDTALPRFVPSSRDQRDWEGVGKIEAFPYTIEADPEIGLFLDKNKDPLAAYRNSGLGRQGTSLLRSTYSWMLQGNQPAYNRYWTKILEVFARDSEPLVEWKIKEGYAYTDEPIDFRIRTRIDHPQVQTADSITITMIQDPLRPYLWSGTFTPRKNGWNSLITLQDSLNPYSFYIFKTGQWESLRAKNRLTFNQNTFKGETPVSNFEQWEMLSPYWFLGIALLCLVWLWGYPRWIIGLN